MATYFITGANRPNGIGFHLCKALSERGETVIATCRTTSPELEALNIQVISGIDLNDNTTHPQIITALNGQKIDVLINNAGIWQDEALGEFSRDRFVHIFQTNTISPLLLTEQLLPQLNRPGKIIMITSRMGCIGDNTSGGRYGYRMSKAALNAAAKSLSMDLKSENITVGIIHPGLVATDMGGPNGIPVTESVENILNRIADYTLENSGTLYHANGQTLPW